MPQVTRSHSPGVVRGVGTQSAGLDIGSLESEVQRYFALGLAPSTQRTYKSGKDRFLKFCQQAGSRPIPVCESTLCGFCVSLAKEKLNYRTIKVYLSAIRHMQLEAGGHVPFVGAPLARLHYVLRGIRKEQAALQQGESRQRLPITPHLLRSLKKVWEEDASKADKQRLWAASCLAFFAFLRVGEMTVPSVTGFDPAVHLSISDVAVDDPRRSSAIRVRIKQSKTDPFRRGIDLFVGKTACPLCPVAAILDYLRIRGTAPGPLFQHREGRPLTRACFAAEVRSALKKAGVDPEKYCTHSFRIGAASTAAARGIEDSVIKTWGGGRARHTYSMCAFPGKG